MKQAQNREQIRDATDAELENMLKEERKNLFMSRKDAAMKQLENPKKINQIRKNIARILTIKRERALRSAEGTK